LIFADQLGKTQETVVNVINIVISAYIIIMNYEFDKRDFDRQILTLEKSTTELRELHYAARQTSVWTINLLDDYTEQYNILREYKFQTEERDYQYVMLVNTNLRGSNYRSPSFPAFLVRIRHHFSHFILIAVWNIFPVSLIIAAVYVLIRFRT